MTITDVNEQDVEGQTVATPFVDDLRARLAERQANGEVDSIATFEQSMVDEPSITVRVLHEACDALGLEWTSTQSRTTLIKRLVAHARGALANESLVAANVDTTTLGATLAGFRPWAWEDTDERSVMLRRLCDAPAHQRKLYVGGQPDGEEEAAVWPAEQLLLVKVPRRGQMPALVVVVRHKGDNVIAMTIDGEHREVAPWQIVATKQVPSYGSGKARIDSWYSQALGEMAQDVLAGAFDESEPSLESIFDDDDSE